MVLSFHLYRVVCSFDAPGLHPLEQPAAGAENQTAVTGAGCQHNLDARIDGFGVQLFHQAGRIQISPQTQLVPDLAKYYVFTGDTISAAKADDLGLVARLVKPAEVDQAIRDIVDQGVPDKNRSRDLPEAEQALARLCAGDNAQHLLTGKAPRAVDADFAAKTAKKVGYKAPIALKMANDIIDQQVNLSMEDAVAFELDRLTEIFSTEDALEGLTSVGGRRPVFKGR